MCYEGCAKGGAFIPRRILKPAGCVFVISQLIRQALALALQESHIPKATGQVLLTALDSPQPQHTHTRALSQQLWGIGGTRQQVRCFGQS